MNKEKLQTMILVLGILAMIISIILKLYLGVLIMIDQAIKQIEELFNSDFN